MWTSKQDTERREKMSVLVWNILFPIHLLTPESTTTPGQHVWFTHAGHIPKAMAVLTSKEQAMSGILKGEDLSIQVPTKHLSF